MKLKEVSCYQAAKFQGKMENFFTAARIEMSDLSMEVMDWGILVKSGKDQVILSFANIAWAKPYVEEAKSKK